MEEILKKHIEKKLNQTLSKEIYDQFSKLVFEKSFDKKKQILEEGTICNYMYFVKQGACYKYFTDTNGNKQVAQFAIEDYWVSDLCSFFSGRKAEYSIETVEPTIALLLNRENFQKACDIAPVFDRFFRILIQNAYIALQRNLGKHNSSESEELYTEFSKSHPQFIQRFPQYLIASNLGIKPQSLSRIRKEITTKN